MPHPDLARSTCRRQSGRGVPMGAYKWTSDGVYAAKARATLDEAARLDPASPHIQGNLALLASWKTGERPAELDPKR